MFADESLEPVYFNSSWKKERYVTEHGVQTAELDVRDVACQSIKRRHKEVQTEEEAASDFYLAEDEAGHMEEFLTRVVPFMCKQLQANLRSQAFHAYDLSLDDEEESVSTTHVLTNAALNEQLQVTSLSWNSTGAVLAASFGRYDHEDWCTHKSTLCTWNLDRQKVDQQKANTTIDVTSCLMCVACHPKEPAVIVGGTFNGEVIVWDTSREDEMMVASSGIGDDSHREPVSKVLWVLDPDSHGKKYLVVSTSSDGKVLVWKPHYHKQVLRLIDGFALLTESLPRHIRVKAKRTDQEMGVTCISFNKDDISSFLMGAESGGIFKCSVEARGTLANAHMKSSVELRSPVTFCYEPHHGPVYSVEWCPHHRNLFLSSSMDASVRIYSLLQTQPLISVEPGMGYLYSVRWCPVKPSVFVVCTEAGKFLVYELKGNRAVLAKSLDAGEKKVALFTTQFNTKQRKLIATGDGLGYIRVWSLSNELTSPVSKETEILEQLASSILE